MVRFVAALLAVVIASSAFGAPAVVAPLSDADEAALGDVLAPAIAARVAIVTDAEVVERVETMAVALLRDGLAPWAWRVHVVDDVEVASFDAPGGHLYVTTGLLHACDDATLRAVLAHQAAHALRKDTSHLLLVGYGPDVVQRMIAADEAAVTSTVAANLAASGTLARHGDAVERAADERAVSIDPEPAASARALLALYQRIPRKRERADWADDQRLRRVARRFVDAHPASKERLEELARRASP